MKSVIIVLIIFTVVTKADLNLVHVQKCCERSELMLDNRCDHVNGTKDSELWSPMFSDEKGHDNIQVKAFSIIIGIPQCGPRQLWPIFHYPQSHDSLKLLPDGRLRHYYPLHHEIVEGENGEKQFHDYEPGTYCMDKAVTTLHEPREALYALVCTPDTAVEWTTEYLMRQVIDPASQALTIVCLLVVTLVYFVMPQLRDLVGNIISTLCMCLILSKTAHLVRVFPRFRNHVSYTIADTVVYFSLLAAFLWLNSLGYYIWKTFRSRNVFLRSTDARKYCYYSLYAWSCTIALACIALFAHFVLDAPPTAAVTKAPLEWDSIGSLGIAMFFTPIAFTILVNIFFCVSTVRAVNRMTTYGRIHQRMKYNLEIFLKLFVVLGVDWIFLLMSWSQYEPLFYCHVTVGAFVGPLILYICILGQKRIRFLLHKSCCYDCNCCCCCCCRSDNDREGPDWGEEMMAMNVTHF